MNKGREPIRNYLVLDLSHLAVNPDYFTFTPKEVCMALLILPLSFILIFLVFNDSARDQFSGSIVRTTILFSLFTLAGTEILSLFHSFNTAGVISYWSMVSAALLAWAYYAGKLNAQALNPFKRALHFITIKNNFRAVYVLITLMFCIILLKGIAYPPSNYDSLTYHMARVAHWIANEGVWHYPTHNYSQLFQPPFAEYLIAHIHILSRNDVFSNCVQLFYLLSIMSCTFCFCKELGLNRVQTLLALLFIATTPMAILQASTTQNDVVVSFFILATAYYAFVSLQSKRTRDIAWMSVTAGMAILTKGTAYIYLTPILLIWAVVSIKQIIHAKKLLRLSVLFIVPAIILTLNACQYCRSYKLSGNILGSPEVVYYNTEYTPGALYSNLVRNGSLHLEMFFIHTMVEKATIKTFDLLHINKNDPATTFGQTLFMLNNWSHNEDRSSNIIQFLLIFTAGFILMLHNRKYFYLFQVVMLEVILFCLVLKWQPWHSRLHTPIFILAAIPVAVAFSRYMSNFFFRWLFLSGIILYAFVIVLFEYARPVITIPPYTANITLLSPRYEKYFPYSTPEYINNWAYLKQVLDTNEKMRVGLICPNNRLEEYPLWVDNQKNNNVKIYHIKVKNISCKIPQDDTCRLDYIIAMDTVDFIAYRNESYKRMSAFKKLNLYR